MAWQKRKQGQRKWELVCSKPGRASAYSINRGGNECNDSGVLEVSKSLLESVSYNHNCCRDIALCYHDIANVAATLLTT